MYVFSFLQANDIHPHYMLQLKPHRKKDRIIGETLPLLNEESIDESHIHIIDGYVGKGYAQSRPIELNELKALAKAEGLILDPVYTEKAYFGLKTEIEKGTFSHAHNILFIHTGGIFGLLSKTNEF